LFKGKKSIPLEMPDSVQLMQISKQSGNWE